MDKRIDLGVAAAVTFLGIWLLLLASDLREGSVSDPVGTAGVPRAVGAILAVGGAIILVRRVRSWGASSGWLVENEGKSDDPGYPASTTRALGVAAGTLLYARLLEPLGFLVATPAFLVGTMVAMGERRLSRVLAMAVLGPAVVHLVFAGLFGILLPLGPLSPFDRWLWFRF